MANYRNISISFWTDSKIDDEFTPEDKYFYLYLLTNPHTNICGCYEVSMKQMERETGYNTDTIKRLLRRMQYEHKVIFYSESTKEVLILNWCRYNWTDSENVKKAVIKVSQYIKNNTFKRYVMDTVSIGYPYTMVTSVSDTDTDTVSETDTETDTETENRYRDNAEKPQPSKPVKHKHGEYNNVLLTDEELEKLKAEIPNASEYIERLSSYIASKGTKYKSHYATIRNWYRKDEAERPKPATDEPGAYDIDYEQLKREGLNW